MNATDLPIRAATETMRAHGIEPDRCDILQNSSTLVVRLTETVVARVVQDRDGPRQGTAWFARENAVAQHLTQHGAPVIPLHPDLPPGPYEHLGYPLNFWKFVTRIEDEPAPDEIGTKLRQCHEVLKMFPEPLPKMAIVTESLGLLDTLAQKALLPLGTLELLKERLESSLAVLERFPQRAVHGDAHMGNLMNTTEGLLWTDWEDAFAGPVEWDVASVIWNAQLLEGDQETVDAILSGYRETGGQIDPVAMQQSLIARAAVISAWYPILYPNPSAERQEKLRARIEWLEKVKD